MELALHALSTSEHLSSSFSLYQIRILLNELWMPVFNSITSSLNSCKPCVIGITGPPGTGKTSLSVALSILIEQATEGNTTRLSLEDFYYPPHIRLSKGLKWRALPGSHDLDGLKSILGRISSGEIIDYLPRYDMKRDCIEESVPVNQIITNLVLEGWLLVTNLKDYEFVAKHINHLVYLDASIGDCKKWRFEREEGYRKEDANAGYDEQRMRQFWEEVLEPGITQWVIPQRERADTIVYFDHHHNVKEIMQNDNANAE